ncbi:hypothetical protein CAEBREN_28584 [Caenorhabditis brenneri]|uniref:DUF5641 domain-containing protein n=1 Tax=Caenorhabditis brenneri TaxID=135651 RepID=G0PKH1_CAEBE|nr:hypothetical protein CAEBREN_28584 [Caenorhabditis brenneri]
MIALRPKDFINPGFMIVPDGTSAYITAGCTKQTLKLHLNTLEDTLKRMWKVWALGYFLHLRKNLLRSRLRSEFIPSFGQMVIIAINLVLRHKRPMGIFTQINISERDGDIRSAIVRCKGIETTRAVGLLISPEVPSLYQEEATGNTDPTDLSDLPKASGIQGSLDSYHELRGTASPDLSTAQDLSTDEPILPSTVRCRYKGIRYKAIPDLSTVTGLFTAEPSLPYTVRDSCCELRDKVIPDLSTVQNLSTAEPSQPSADTDRGEHSDQAILNLSTAQDLSTAEPSLPSPAVCDIERAEDAPELFPPNTLPKIAEPYDGNEHTLIRVNFNKNIEVLPTVDSDGDSTEVADIPDDIVGEKYYVEPNKIQCVFIRPSEFSSEGCSRAYLPCTATDETSNKYSRLNAAPLCRTPHPGSVVEYPPMSVYSATKPHDILIGVTS